MRRIPGALSINFPFHREIGPKLGPGTAPRVSMIDEVAASLGKGRRRHRSAPSPRTRRRDRSWSVVPSLRTETFVPLKMRKSPATGGTQRGVGGDGGMIHCARRERTPGTGREDGRIIGRQLEVRVFDRSNLGRTRLPPHSR